MNPARGSYRAGFSPTIKTMGIPFAQSHFFTWDQHETSIKELIMTEERKLKIALYVDRSSQQWIALDPEGQFWILPVNEEDVWNQRQPFCPTDETNLEPIPGHYKNMLGLSA
jgi:hypothetical protein